MAEDTAVRASAAGPAERMSGRVRARAFVRRVAVRFLDAVLGEADGATVAAVAMRELALILRSRDWNRFQFVWVTLSAMVLLTPLLFRLDTGRWDRPTGNEWFGITAVMLQILIAMLMAQWTIRRLRADLYTDRLDELMLTRCSPADIAMGEALGSAVASLWLVLVSAPVCLFLASIAGHGARGALQLMLSLAPPAALGVWFGMGWGLAFTLRRSGSVVALTGWWVLVPLLPLWLGASMLGLVTVFWALLGLIPGGSDFLRYLLSLARHGLVFAMRNLDPIMVPVALARVPGFSWFGNWVALCLVTLLMLRKSTDAVHASLASLPERDNLNRSTEAWIHHDVHVFTQFGENQRRVPGYYDGGNPIAAFDVALGHRVYLHPFLWTLMLLAYLFLLGWSMLLPGLGRETGVLAALIPATAALLMMSGGVVVSFGWERQQLRWPSLAVLPISDYRLAFGKIKGVVRPNLWLGLLAALTAMVMGWRGAIHWDSALWLGLHVLVFPVVLSAVSAVLALTKRSLEDALYWWAILGALPTLASILPHPIGGPDGLALPLTPPLLALLIVLSGPRPELIHASIVSLTIQLLGLCVALVILGTCLRRLTVGERD